jgi:site-specific DNA-adenine methylase
MSQERLQELETIMADSEPDAQPFWSALYGIKRQKLYRLEYSNFEEYCNKKHNLSGKYIYHIIIAASVWEDIKEVKDIDTSQLRMSVLFPLRDLDADDRVEAWQRALKDSNGEVPTSEQVEKAVRLTRGYPLLGKKYRLGKQIAEIIKSSPQFPSLRGYLEPFLGSGSLYLRLRKEGALPPGERLLNDYNYCAVVFYRIVMSHPEELYRRIASSTPTAEEILNLDSTEPGIEEEEVAYRWVTKTYLNFLTKYNDIKFSLQFSERAYPKEEWNRLPETISLLQEGFKEEECQILNQNELEFIKNHVKPGSLLVCDPPNVGNQSDNPDKFSRHEELSKLLTELPPGMIIVTYHDHPTIQELYPQHTWHWHYSQYSNINNDKEVILVRKDDYVTFFLPPPPTDRVERAAERIKKDFSQEEISRLIALLKEEIL